MIKPVEEDALNMSSKLYVKCPKCGYEDTLTKIPPIDTSNQAELDELRDFPCPKCGVFVTEDERTKQAEQIIYKPVTRIPCVDCKRNGVNSMQIRNSKKVFICERKPLFHRTAVRPEHN